MCMCETYTKKSVHIGMYMWEVIPCERTLDLHNQRMNIALYKRENLCSRDTGNSIWGLRMCLGRQISKLF